MRKGLWDKSGAQISGTSLWTAQFRVFVFCSCERVAKRFKKIIMCCLGMGWLEHEPERGLLGRLVGATSALNPKPELFRKLGTRIPIPRPSMEFDNDHSVEKGIYMWFFLSLRQLICQDVHHGETQTPNPKPLTPKPLHPTRQP